MGFLQKDKPTETKPQPVHEKKDLAAKYKAPPEEFSYRQLKLAAWYVKNKILLQKIGIGLLIFWCVVSIGYGIFKWGDYFIFGYFADKEMVERQVAEVQELNKR